jgi:hypothetical protein
MQPDDGDVRVFQGQWWRFDRYEVVGRQIRPARGARLECYDPWELVRSAPYVELGRLGEAIQGWYQELVRESFARYREAVVAPANATHEELLAFIDETQAALAGAYPAPVQLPSEMSRLLTAWCERFGLLGIFQQEVVAVNLEAHPEVLIDVSEIVGELPDDHLLSRYRRLERRGDGWRTLSLRARTREKHGTHADLAHKTYAELQRTSRWPLDESRLPPATVLRRRLPAAGDAAALDLEELSGAKDACFGSARVSGFPVPDSEGFWRSYGEDVVEFAHYAVTLAEALSGVQGGDAEGRAPHLERLNELLGPVSLVLREEQGKLRSSFGSPSLIGVLGAMAYFDIAGGARFAHCERCARLYAKRRTVQRFCSPACQDAAKKRRRYESDAAYRERERDAARKRSARAQAGRVQQRSGGCPDGAPGA